MSLGLSADAKETRRKGSVTIALMVALRAHVGNCVLGSLLFQTAPKKPRIAMVFFIRRVLRNTMGPSLVRLTMGDTYHIGFGDLDLSRIGRMLRRWKVLSRVSCLAYGRLPITRTLWGN